MGLKAAVQALKKAEELKARVSRHNDLLNNSEVWSDQQQLQTIYHQVLVMDLEYALDKKVEQELWTLGFKNHIAALQHLAKDKKNSRRSESQALLSWCLEAASGFYLTLLQELCSAFDLDLPFRRRDEFYGQSKREQLNHPHRSSCLYICQYCLVHLGDIARYRLQRKQAESFYRHAIVLSPSSGQPYNQLALLEANRGDKLATVFYYVRSISVKNPFPAAATNLANTLSTIIDNEDSLTEIRSKLSLSEFISIFLRIHGLLHFGTHLDQAEICIKSLNTTFTALVATKVFSTTKLIQMTAINLHALRHVLNTFRGSEQLTPDECRVKMLILDLIAGAFSAYLLPIYTLANDETLLDYYALPAIKLILDWIKTEPNIVKDPVFTKRLQIWPSLCKLLNSLQQFIEDFDYKDFENKPLPEDRDLQCFLPLISVFKDFNFTTENLDLDQSVANKLRARRLVILGIWLATQMVENDVLFTATKSKCAMKVIFEPVNKQPDPTTELLEELKHFTLKETKEIKQSSNKSNEKRSGGILKPQGSLEKAREEREREQSVLFSTIASDSNSTTSSNSIRSSISNESFKTKRVRQNIALQTLAAAAKKSDDKQVTFQTEPIVKSAAGPPVTTHVVPTLPLYPMPVQEPIRMQQPHFNLRAPPPPINTVPFPLQFNMNVPPPPLPFQQQQSLPIQPPQLSPLNTDQFGPWLREDKPPMPPTAWWTNNQLQKTHPYSTEICNPGYGCDFNRSGVSSYGNGDIGGGISISAAPPQPPPKAHFGSVWTNVQQQQMFGTGQTHSMGQMMQQTQRDSNSMNDSMPGYSLFNSNWAPNLTVHGALKSSPPDHRNVVPPLMRQQSLFSNPGPSPLERLLEQQKQMRGGGGAKNDN